MEMKEIIRQRRKKCGLTQEQMAAYLGVSAPAVNKWESGATCPDLSILPALARLLQTDPNTLLGFHENLSKEEITLFGNEVAEIIKDGRIETAFEMIKRKVEEYPACGQLQYQMATLLRGAKILFDFSEEENRKANILAVSLYERAMGCKEQKFVELSRYALASMYIMEEKYEKATELANLLPDYQQLDKRQLQISIYMKQKKYEEAARLMEVKLYGLIQEVFLNLDQLACAAVCEGNHERAWELADYSKKVMEIYNWDYSGYVVSFSVAMKEKDAEKAMKILKKMLLSLEKPEALMESPLFSHQKKKDLQSSFGKQMISSILKAIEKEEEYKFIWEREDYQKLIRTIKMQ